MIIPSDQARDRATANYSRRTYFPDHTGNLHGPFVEQCAGVLIVPTLRSFRVIDNQKEWDVYVFGVREDGYYGSFDIALEAGAFPAWTWPGCYPYAYYYQGDVLCPKCVRKAFLTGDDPASDAIRTSDPSTYRDVLWEESETCSECNETIEPAYQVDESNT